MQRVATYVTGDVLPAADVNNIQDTALGIAQTVGYCLGASRMRATTTQVSVSRVAAFQSGTEDVVSGTPAALSVGSSLSAGTWYYVYLYNNAGTLTLELATTVPDASLAHKNGDTSRRYMGAVLAVSTSAILPCVRHGLPGMGRAVTIWRPSGTTACDFEKTTSASIVAQTVAVTASTFTLVPPHCRAVLARIVLNNTSGADHRTYILTESDANLVEFVWAVTGGRTTVGPLELDLGESQVLKVQHDTATSFDVRFYWHGFVE